MFGPINPCFSYHASGCSQDAVFLLVIEKQNSLKKTYK